jgi:F-type H+-transporting ATPase subunit epsilon
MKIQFKIVTPERVVYESQIEQATLPTQEGEITILPNHIPLISVLKAGELRLKEGNNLIVLAISGGFLEFQNNTLTILANTAERVEEIDLARAEEARRRAEELKLKTQKQVDEREYAMLASKIEKELARIKVARKYRHASRPTISSEHLEEQEK